MVSFQTWSADSSRLSFGVKVGYVMPGSSRKAELQPWACRELAELATEPSESHMRILIWKLICSPVMRGKQGAETVFLEMSIFRGQKEKNKPNSLICIDYILFLLFCETLYGSRYPIRSCWSTLLSMHDDLGFFPFTNCPMSGEKLESESGKDWTSSSLGSVSPPLFF